jgi:hypothetical protein
MSGCWANDGTIPVAYYRCNDCGVTGLTGEFWLPPEASLTSLDADRRLANRMAKRRERGIAWRTRDLRKGMRMTDDTIAADIRIIPGKVQRGLRKRLPGLRRKRPAKPLDNGATASDTGHPTD